jgi:hypothetical protein
MKGKRKQRTTKGLEIPIPTKSDFDANLAKVAPPASRKRPGGKDRPLNELIQATKFIQDRKRMIIRVIPSRVWLSGLDLNDVVAAQTLEPPVDGSLPLARFLDDGERMVLGAGGPVEFREQADEVVKSRAQLMDIVAGKNPKDQRWWLEVLRTEDVPAGIRIVLGDVFVRCAFPGLAFSVERFKMRYSPPDAFPASVEMVHA